MPSVVVLYEDKSPGRCFGVHKLLVSCIHDRLGGARSDMKAAIDGRPLKGNTRVLTACRDELEILTRGGTPLVAVLDDDKIRARVGLEAFATEPEVLRRIAEQYGSSPLLTVGLLKDNAETLVADANRAGVDVRSDKLDKALGKRGRRAPEARDSILNRVAFGEQRYRDQILRLNSSFARIVEIVAALL